VVVHSDDAFAAVLYLKLKKVTLEAKTEDERAQEKEKLASIAKFNPVFTFRDIYHPEKV
jgi:hypothetical protein